MAAKVRFTKAEILKVFAREEQSYRLGILCTHWIRDVEQYVPNAASLARGLHMRTDARWVSGADLAALLEDPMKRDLLSSEFLLTYLHTLIRAPFELLSDYCEDFDRATPSGLLLAQLKSAPWHDVAYIVRNAVSHNFHIEFGKLRDKLPITWRSVTFIEDMEGQPMTAEIFWHRPGYELFLEMRAFAETLPEVSKE